LSTILLVDDDKAFRKALGKSLERRGYSAAYAESGSEALSHPSLMDCEAAVVDMRMPGMDGLTLLKKMHQIREDLPVIVLTGHGTISTAIEAIKNGAFHYLTKPCEISELEIYLEKAITSREVIKDNKNLREAIHHAEQSHGIIGKSPAIAYLLNLIQKVKNADSAVLITGESGTGKELVARALHFQSSRSEMPFIALNCATLKPELLENELFGHVAGAFTGATNRKEGLLTIADRGTLFIDEIADMDTNVQASLLRVIETGEYRPLGSTKEYKTHVRIVAAANRDLAAEVEAKHFREDLYYRLSVIVLKTPPLCEHAEDIPLLVESFLRQSSAAKKGVYFSHEAVQRLQNHHWKGNVRELFNICERALLMRDNDTITETEIDVLLSMHTSISPSEKTLHQPDYASTSSSLDDVERSHIVKILNQTANNISKTAELLRIDRRTLQRKMDRYGLDRS